MTDHGAAVVHVVDVAMRVGAKIQTGRHSGKRPAGRIETESAIAVRIAHLIGVRIGSDPLVEWGYGRGEPLQTILKNSLLFIQFEFQILFKILCDG